MFPTEISNLPGQIEAALRTELEVKDSALTVLLEYFNHPVPAPEQRQSLQPSAAIGKPGELPT